MARRDVSRKNNRVTSYQEPVFQVDGAVVYFIGTPANDLMKVGRTSRFRDRFARISAQSPVPIIAFGLLRFSSVEAAAKAEMAIQAMLTKASRHSHGEWYRLPVSGLRPIANHFIGLGIEFVEAKGEASMVQLSSSSEQDIYYQSLAAPRTGFAVRPLI